MILIADSGSTKTYWSLLKGSSESFHYKTSGINPFFESELQIETHLRKQLLQQMHVEEINAIYFFGAGCATEKQKQVMINAFEKVFRFQKIVVESDLLGAAKALCGDQQGIVCILGTGSNSGFYDGESIVKQVAPLGYIIGDEGSGAALGKKLVADCLKNQLSPTIQERFFNRFSLSQAEIVENIYTKPFPSRFLASLSIFLHENLDEPELYQLVYDSFTDFFKRNVFQYDYQHYKVQIVGSIGYYYQHVLRHVATDLSIDLGEIVQAPMEKLILYYQPQNALLEPTRYGI
jgi:N-acetylglucosamine kinase-like BadF-type ATPase